MIGDRWASQDPKIYRKLYTSHEGAPLWFWLLPVIVIGAVVLLFMAAV